MPDIILLVPELYQLFELEKLEISDVLTKVVGTDEPYALEFMKLFICTAGLAEYAEYAVLPLEAKLFWVEE